MVRENLGTCGPSNLTRALQHPKRAPERGPSLFGDSRRLTPCPDTSRCPSSIRTVFVYRGGAQDAAFGNLFFATAINAILYAQHKMYVPLVSLDHSWVKRTMGSAWLLPNGTGQLWEHFFASTCPGVAAWVVACPETVRMAPNKPLDFFFPGFARRFKWTVHQWYNVDSPAHRACTALAGQVPFQRECWEFNETLYRRWRSDGSAVVRNHHRLSPATAALVEAAWHRHGFGMAGVVVLGLHMRGSDKRSGRRKVYPCAFDPYVESFFAAFPQQGRVYVATESVRTSHFLRAIIIYCRACIGAAAPASEAPRPPYRA